MTRPVHWLLALLLVASAFPPAARCSVFPPAAPPSRIYLYAHGNPVNGVDPSGNFTGSVNETLLVISGRLTQFVHKSQNVVRAINKSYVPIVTGYVLVNLTMAATDEMTLPYAMLAAPYQYQLLKKFKAHQRLAPSVMNKIRRLVRFTAKGLASVAEAESKGVEIKENGFPNFSPYVNPDRGTTFITLNGNRKSDEREANRNTLRKKTPRGYTWHHHEVPGIMQLVKRSVHSGVNHGGGVMFYEILTNSTYR